VLLSCLLQTLERSDMLACPVYVLLCYRGDAAHEAQRVNSSIRVPAAGRITAAGPDAHAAKRLSPGIGAGRCESYEYDRPTNGLRTPEIAARMLNAIRRRFEMVVEAECDAILDRGAAAACRAGGATLVATAAPNVRVLTYAPELMRRSGRRALDTLFTMLTLQLVS